MYQTSNDPELRQNLNNGIISPFTAIFDEKIVVTYNHSSKRFTLTFDVKPVSIDDELVLAHFILDKLGTDMKLFELYRVDVTETQRIDYNDRIICNDFIIGSGAKSPEMLLPIIVRYLKYVKHSYKY